MGQLEEGLPVEYIFLGSNEVRLIRSGIGIFSIQAVHRILEQLCILQRNRFPNG